MATKGISFSHVTDIAVAYLCVSISEPILIIGPFSNSTTCRDFGSSTSNPVRKVLDGPNTYTILLTSSSIKDNYVETN